MEHEEVKYMDFIDAAKHYADKIGAVQIAEKYPCSKNHIYQVINEDKTAGRMTQSKFAKACGFNTVSEFVNSIKKSTPDYPPIETQEDWEHYTVTRKFKNKRLAIDINKLLVKLESLSPIALGRMAGIIEDEVKRIEEVSPEKSGTLGE